MSAPRPPTGTVPRLRPWRVAALSTSCALTLSASVVVLAGSVTGAPAAANQPAAPAPEAPTIVDGGTGDSTAPEPDAARAAAGGTGNGAGIGRDAPADPVADARAGEPPRGSGQGRRVVFDQSAQQVWLVRDGGSVGATYAVSGSRHDNLQPGRYAVFSRSRHAVGFDYRSTMDWMVRFTEGDNAAIGFHDIPVDVRDRPLQQWNELGTPQSSGCIRQRPRDARELWRFAPVGTPVVVVA